MKVGVASVCFYEGNPYPIGEVLEVENSPQVERLIAAGAFVVCAEPAGDANVEKTGEKAKTPQNNKARKAQENK